MSTNESTPLAQVEVEFESQESTHAPVEAENPHSPAATSIEASDTQTANEGNTNRKDRLVSDVWQTFIKKIVNGIIKAECKHCKKLLVAGAKMGTNYLRHHSKTCTKRYSMDIRQRILTKDVVTKDLKSQAFDQDEARNRLASMITIHDHPLSMVDHHGFQEFCSSLQPLFKCPTRNTIKSDILKLYKLERAKKIKFLEKNGNRIALTTDMWTSSNQKKGFMVVTTHFIDNSWILRSQLLMSVL